MLFQIPIHLFFKFAMFHSKAEIDDKPDSEPNRKPEPIVMGHPR